MAFASTLGWGVAASAIPVAIYQGFWTVIGFAARFSAFAISD
jgi:uncharacterized membrane protein YqgA involved in biofilm formation